MTARAGNEQSLADKHTASPPARQVGDQVMDLTKTKLSEAGPWSGRQGQSEPSKMECETINILVSFKSKSYLAHSSLADTAT